MDNPSNDWTIAGNSFFRKIEVYSLSWSSEIDFEKFYVMASCFGGPIALTKDIDKPDCKPVIFVYSASGQKIAYFKCDTQCRLIGLGWTCMEDLLLITEKETFVYDVYGNLKTMLSIGPDMKDSRVVDFKCFNTINTYTNSYMTGIIFLTSKMKFHMIKDVYNVKLQKFPDIPVTVQQPTVVPNTWCVISTEKKCSILASKGTELFQLTLDGNAQVLSLGILNRITSTITDIIPSFTNELIAIATENGSVFLCNSDLTRLLYEYTPTIKDRPKYLAWCSNCAIVVCWDTLIVVTIDGETLAYYDDPPFHFVQEIDGVRILTPAKHEFLQIVPKSLENIFRIGANGPASILYEASIAFYKDKSQRADEYIRTIKKRGQLEETINDCIDAASHEYEPKYQKDLMHAALFGRYFEEYANPSAFVKMCQTLRVLNAIRHHLIGIPLTYVQFQALTVPVVINRLVLRRHYELAMKICEYLNVPEQEGSMKILLNWALYKVRQRDFDDETIARMIGSKLGDTSGISFAEISRCAITSGRTGLALKLLEYETKASEQVPLYMQMKNPELALRKAIESGDSDLIYMVLFWCKDQFNNVSDFMKDISKNPVAMSLMLQYYRQNDVNKLCDILNQENLNIEHGLSLVKVAYKQNDNDQKMKLLDEAQRLFRTKDEFNLSVMKRLELISEEIRLIKIQNHLTKTYRLQLSGKSLYQTIGELIKNNILKEAEELRKEFKIADSDKSWWYLRVKYLAEGQLWDELEKFSKSKKPPIGFEPFVSACMKQNNAVMARKYYPKVLPENRVKCLIQMKNLSEALDLAFETKDIDGINMVLGKCDVKQKALIDKARAMKNSLLKK